MSLCDPPFVTQTQLIKVTGTFNAFSRLALWSIGLTVRNQTKPKMSSSYNAKRESGAVG